MDATRPEPPPGAARAAVAGWALAIAVATLAAYAGSFPGAWAFDDFASIVDNPSIRRLWPPTAFWSPPVEAGVGGRPLANLSFAVNHALGGLDPAGYHAANLALHLAAALALFGVLRRTLARPAFPARVVRAATRLAAVAAIAWSVHPLTTAAVNYASQRTELLMALCWLLTLYAFIRSLDSTAAQRWRVLSVAACAAGMASKEVMVTAPLAVWLYDGMFVAGGGRAAWRSRRGFYAALAGTWLLLGALVLPSRLAERGVGLDQGVPVWRYALTEAHALLIYLQRAVWPDALVFDYGWSFDAPGIGAYLRVALVLGLVAAAGQLLRRRRAAGFAGVVFFLLLAPTSSLVPIVQQPIAESRMYLPLAVLVATAGVGLYRLAPCLAWPVFGAAALALGALTAQRHVAYQSEVSLWRDTVAKRPDSARAHGNLGAALLRAGRPAEAIAAAEKALALRPGYAAALENVALALAQTGRVAESLRYHALALQARPDAADAHYNFGEALVLAGREADAAAQYETALRLEPRHVRAHNNLAVLLLRRDQPAAAEAHLRAALRLAPDFAEAHYNLGNVLARTGATAAAAESFATALRCDPRFARAHNNLGALALRAGRVAEAIGHFEAALKIAPDYAEAQRNLALARAGAGTSAR